MEANLNRVSVTAENIGGIDHAEVDVPPGVTVLTGRNATNRTSFLYSLMAALGSDTPSLKAGHDEGYVELELGEETYFRRLTRSNGNVSFQGSPYLEDAELADLFAFLLEDNEARRAVELGEDLRELLMRPIDTHDIERRVEELEHEKRSLDEEIEHREQLEDDLPELQAERTSIEEELEAKREELAAVETELEAADVDPEESKTRQEELESIFDELRERRSTLEDIRFDVETERATIRELQAEREDLNEDLDSLSRERDTSPARLDGRIEELRARKRSLDETASELQSVISFNEEMLEEDGSVVAEVFEEADGGGDVTDQLLESDRTTCWTCGSEVDTGRIEETLDHLRELRTEKLGERNELREQIDELTSQRDHLRSQKQKQERISSRLDRIDEELATSRDRIEELEERRERLETEVEELEAETESFDDTDYSETLERHREATGLELEIETLEDDLEAIDAEIEDHREMIADCEELVEHRDEINRELTDLRTRVEDIERDAVESFNQHMASVLGILEYENIERIWIERREREVREGRRKVLQTTFDLHIVRSTGGTAHRDTVDNLSESEREVTGLVFALAGYLVHDLHEEVPFILLDSLEAIDSDRIAAVVDYFSDYAEFLLVALLPEDADALPAEYTSVEEI